MLQSRGLLFSGLLCSSAVFSSAALAQEMPEAITPPDVTMTPNGLNLLTGQMMMERPSISVPAAPRLTFSRLSDFFMYSEGSRPYGDKTTPPPSGTASNGGFVVHYGGMKSERFDCLHNACTTGNNFSILAPLSATPNPRDRYDQAPSGTTYHFDQQAYSYETVDAASDRTILQTTYMAGSVVYPDGEILTFTYEAFDPNQQSDLRPTRVQSNTGYYLELSYWDSIGVEGWGRVREASIYSNADAASPLAQLSFSSDGHQFADLEGQTWTCPASSECGSSWMQSPWGTNDELVLPGDTTPAISFSSQTNGFLVDQVEKGGLTWQYTYNGLAQHFFEYLTSGGTVTTGERKSFKYGSLVVTNPDGSSRTYEMQTASNPNTWPHDRRYIIEHVKSMTDELGRVTNYQYVKRGSGHYGWFPLEKVISPERGSVEFDYDSFGNLLKQTTKPKPGDSAPVLFEEAGYVACKQAGWRVGWQRDAAGNQTDIEYNSACQPIFLTGPADPSGARLRTTMEYEQYDTGNGVLSRKTAIHGCEYVNGACQATVGPRIEYDYWRDTFLVSEERHIDQASGDILRICRSYDEAGRLVSETNPRAGLATCQ